jgi:hypothetical protein
MRYFGSLCKSLVLAVDAPAAKHAWARAHLFRVMCLCVARPACCCTHAFEPDCSGGFVSFSFSFSFSFSCCCGVTTHALLASGSPAACARVSETRGISCHPQAVILCQLRWLRVSSCYLCRSCAPVQWHLTPRRCADTCIHVTIGACASGYYYVTSVYHDVAHLSCCYPRIDRAAGSCAGGSPRRLCSANS